MRPHPQLIIPATVEAMPKRGAIWVEHADKRRLVVSLGGHEWDLLVPEDEFSSAMATMVVEMRQREKEVLELW